MDYDLEKINVEWSGPLTTVSPNVEWCAQNNYYDLKNKCRVDYDLGKINVEWSGPLTTVAQNNYDLEKINVEWLMPKDITRKNKC